MVASDPFIGQRIEKCQVIRLLSRGGYGTTYLAFDEELQAHRVIKVSHETLGRDPGASHQLKSFLEEGYVLSRLKHPQIVTLRAQGENQGRRYMVLDFVEGLSLREALQRLNKMGEAQGLPWPRVLDPVTATAIIASCLEPLAYAHQARMRLPGRDVEGIAHRDIAPGNLILGRQGDERGKVVLIDFGTAKTDLSDMVTLNQSLIGTLPYMSKPRLQRAQTKEQAEAQLAFWGSFSETRNDIHALGVLYAQLLTGKLPFQGESAPEILVSILDIANYQRLYDEIAVTFPLALPFIKQMVVWFDVKQPLEGQAQQYASAVPLAPAFQRFFQSLGSGSSAESCIEALSRRLQDTEGMEPTATLSPRPNTPQTTSREHPYSLPPVAMGLPVEELSPPAYGSLAPKANPYPRPLDLHQPSRPWGVWLFALAFLGLVLFFGFRIWQGKRNHDSGRARAAFASLEHLGNQDSLKTLPPQSLVPGDDPQQKANTLRSRKKKPTQLQETAGESSPDSLFSSAFLPDSLNPVPPPTPSMGGPGLTREVFLDFQNRIRAKDPAILQEVEGMLKVQPGSPDLRYLRMRWIMEQEPPHPNHRGELADLRNRRPIFLDARLFKENTLFWTWQLNLKLFHSQSGETNRIALIQAAHAYLAAYADNPLYSARVQTVENTLPE